MTPIDWAKRPIQKFADFNGRAPRAEYWWYVLAILVCTIVVSIVESILGLNQMVFGVYGPITLLLALATLVPSIAVTIRRLHDTGRSGWWILIAVIPYLILAYLTVQATMAAAAGDMSSVAMLGMVTLVALAGGIALLVFMILPGNKGDNRYGADPYAGGAAATA